MSYGSPVAPELAAIRKARGMTQRALADRLGCSVKLIRDIERGDCDFNDRRQGAIIRALGIAEGDVNGAFGFPDWNPTTATLDGNYGAVRAKRPRLREVH